MPDLTNLIAAVSTDNCTANYDLTFEQSIEPDTELTADTQVDVRVTDGCGNSSVARFHITVPLSEPSLQVSQPGELCGPASIDVADYVVNTGNWTVNYYRDEELTLPARSTTTTESGEFYAVAIDLTNGCRSEVYPIEVVLYELTIEVAQPITINAGETAEIWVEGVGSQAEDYIYDIHLGNDDVMAHMEGNRYVAVEYPTQNSIYVVHVTNGACQTTATIAVEVYRERQPQTNYFSPDGNGENDYWCYSDEKVREGSKLEIYDRYGKCVYQTTVGGPCWDGYYNGRVLPSGDYWYVVKDTRTGNRYSGHITLKR